MTPEIYVGTLKKTIPLGKLTKETILKVICRELQMDFDEVKNKKTREKEFVYARHLYGYFCRKYTIESLKNIGNFINKNHATIIHSNKTIENWIEYDKGVRILCGVLHNIFNSKMINLKEYELDEIGKEIILKYE